MSVLNTNCVSRGEDGVVIVHFHRPLLSFSVGKDQHWLPPIWPKHLLLAFPRSTSGIRAQLADGIGKPFLQSGDRVPWASRRGVRAGTGAAWGLVRHRAHWGSDTAITACHRVRLCCKRSKKEGGEENMNKVQELIAGYILIGQILQTEFCTKMFNFLSLSHTVTSVAAATVPTGTKWF